MTTSINATDEAHNENTCHDWLRDHLPPGMVLTSWQRWMRSLDWSQSPLGLISSWSLQLRQMVLLIMQDPKPAAINWGDLDTHIYNEAYQHLIGDKHPALQGQDPHTVLNEIWQHEFDPILKQCRRTGGSYMGDGHMLYCTRNGYVEETHHSWKFLPIIGEHGTVAGFLVTVSEVTRDVLAARRTSSIRILRQVMAKAEDLKSFWSLLLEGLGQGDDKDFPMAIAYSKTGSDIFVLEGALGVPLGHPAAPATVQVRLESRGFAEAMKLALKAREPVLVSATDPIFDNELLDGLEWRGFGVPSIYFMVCPISSMAGEIVGVLILGINPRKAIDSDYKDFIRRITDSIDPAKVSSLLLAEENSRSEAECMLTKSKLRILELENRQFADHAPLGVCRLNANGLLEYANDAWYRITGQSKHDNHSSRAWRTTIHNDDLAIMDTFFNDLMSYKGPVTVESRLKKPRSTGPENSGTAFSPTWILASGYTELLHDGSVKNVVCWVTDISTQKAAAKDLEERMENALELKRQQENFIDMISHEIRNPLSAMLHCSDEVIISLEGCLLGLNKIAIPTPYDLGRHMISGPVSLLGTAQHSANTIVYCIQHLRRVVDDVLTLSKLDSDLLIVSPCVVQPVELVREALQIFEGQLQKADIEFEIQEGQSLQNLGIDWVTLDPGRVLQVLMNLTTNAIKFTRTEAIRRIIVKIGASRGIPQPDAINYLPTLGRKTARKYQFLHDPSGESIYLSLAVVDTGRGIPDEQMQALFERFSQGPKTYSQYGGSGLGLWISRQITEMLGGAIGVHSTAGKGSTFAFYIPTQQVKPPEQRQPSIETLVPASIHVGLDAVLFDGETEFLKDDIARGPKRKRSLLTSQRSDQSNSNSSIRVLVVEDNLINQKVLCQQLRKRGFSVEAANHGEDALNMMKDTVMSKNGGPEQRFDVVLMDLEMPVMGGIECTRRIRQVEEEGLVRCHVPIIAVTANARSLHAEAALQAGVDGVTTKPYTINDLVSQIEIAARRC